MSNGKSRSSLSKATNVAEEASCDDQTVNSSRVSRAGEQNHAKASSSSAPKATPAKKKGGLNAATLARIKQEQLARAEADAAAARQAEEDERIRQEQERQEAERLRLEAKRRAKVKEKEKNRIERQRKEGVYRTKGQRAKFHRAQVQLEAAGVDVTLRHTTQPATSAPSIERSLSAEDKPTALASASAVTEDETTKTEDDDSSDDDWECQYSEADGNEQNPAVAESHQVVNDEGEDRSQANLVSVRHRLRRYHKECESRRSTEVLRAPVICVLGHVDAGKTTLLDNLRRTHVQNDEAGGITQQIGATNVPLETLVERTKACQKIISRKEDFLVPGLLVIDTPGHAMFDNLRSRGSSLCDLAILVVDIMNGIQTQTRESIELLTKRRTPFIIALNKIDLLYGWKGDKKRNVECVLNEQDQFTKNHFEKRCNEIIVQFAELGLNAALYYNNPDPEEFYSIVPTSARSSDGMGSLIALIIERSQTTLAKRLAYSDELQATVLEVKTISGLGMAVDVAVINGSLSIGDKIIVPGQEGPIVTQVRALLIPEQNRDIRVATQYNNQKKVVGACGIRLLAKELDKAMAGLPLFVAREPDEIPHYEKEMETLLSTALNALELKDSGVFVQTSTLGSLEAFLKLLKANHIPCAGVNIGPVHRKDVTRASTQMDKDAKWASILAFDVKIERDAQDYAKSLGIKIFQSDGIYTLLDMFVSYQQQLLKENQDKHRHLAVFPCKLKILPQFVFNTSDPLVCGVRVEAGSIRIGTPICVPSRECIDLGRVVSMEVNRKPVDVAVKNMEVAIKIESSTRDASKVYGRHFDENDLLVSRVSRETIDVLKEHFRSEMQQPDWLLLIELKKTFSIV